MDAGSVILEASTVYIYFFIKRECIFSFKCSYCGKSLPLPLAYGR